MVKIYAPTETRFANNGLKILKPRKARVYKEDNGDYYMELEAHIIDLEWLQQGNIIRVNTPWGEQGFRINNPEIKNSVVNIKAQHLYFDTRGYVINKIDAQNVNGQDILNTLFSNTDTTTNFTTLSTVGTIKTNEFKNTSLEEAIAIAVEVWGGHLERDNYTIYLKPEIGVNRGVTIAYEKNLTEITSVEKWDNVCTKIMPIGKDGLSLPEKYIESNVKYSIPFTKTIEFNPSEDTDQENPSAIERDLREQAKQYLEQNKHPEVNYTTKAEIKNIVDIGDTIKVKHKKLNLELETKVIALRYDCIREKFIEIEFGTFKNSLKNLIPNINDKLDKVEKDTNINYSVLDKALKEAKDTIDRYLFEGHRYETDNATYFLDTEDINTAKNIMQISLGGISFSQNGIGGQFTSAWTIDGKFNANFITAGSLTGITISNGNGTFNVSADGRMTAKDVYIVGTITGSTITGSNITGSKVTTENGVFRTVIQGGQIDTSYLIVREKQSLKNVVLLSDQGLGMFSDFTTSSPSYYIKNTGDTNLKSLTLNGYEVATRTWVQNQNYLTTVNPYGHAHGSIYANSDLNSIRAYYSSSGNFVADYGNYLGTASNRWVGAYLMSAPNISSDSRIKTEIEETNEKLIQLILNLPTKTFKYTEGTSGRKHAGIIAQDLEELMEKLEISSQDFAGLIKAPIYKKEDYKEDGEPKEGAQSIDYAYFVRYEELITPTIKLVQKQQEQINELRKEMDQLKKVLEKGGK